MRVDQLMLIPAIVLKASEKQRMFVWNVHCLIEWAYQQDYELTFGEAFRTAEQAALNAKAGLGIVNSLHMRRLAIDLNLFRGDEWLQKTSDHQPLGTYWKSLHSLNRWGGDFVRQDGNHYSMEDGGIK